MSTVVNREEYVDDLDRTWTIEVEFHDNGLRPMYLVTPSGRRWELTPKRTPNPRPQRDAEEPLPLDDL